MEVEKDAVLPKQTQSMKDQGRDISPAVKRAFIESFQELQRLALINADEKGWNIENDLEQLALIHSEVSETLGAIRSGNKPDGKTPEFLGSEAELGDIIIRILTYSASRGWRVGPAIIAKMLFNMTPEATKDAESKAF